MRLSIRAPHQERALLVWFRGVFFEMETFSLLRTVGKEPPPRFEQRSHRKGFVVGTNVFTYFHRTTCKCVSIVAIS